MNHFKLIETTTAAALHQKKQDNKEFMTTDHGRKADDYTSSQTTKFVDESKMPGGFDESNTIVPDDNLLTTDDEINDGVSDDL